MLLTYYSLSEKNKFRKKNRLPIIQVLSIHLKNIYNPWMLHQKLKELYLMKITDFLMLLPKLHFSSYSCIIESYKLLPEKDTSALQTGQTCRNGKILFHFFTPKPRIITTVPLQIILDTANLHF